MPAAKHISRLSPARVIFVSALVVLVGLVVWVAVRAVGPSRDAAGAPTVVIPTVPVGTPLPSVPPSPSPSPSPSASPSRSHSRSASPSPSRTHRSPSPSVSSSAASFSATVKVNASWGQGYVAMVQVTNKGTKAASWSVSVFNRGLSGLRLGGTWNAQGHQSGTTFVFTGSSLAAGQTASFGFQAGQQGSGTARPSGCSVTGGGCRVS